MGIRNDLKAIKSIKAYRYFIRVGIN